MTPSSISAAPTPRWLRLALPGLLFVATFLAFLPSLDNELVDFDDQALLVINKNYRGLEAENLAWMFRATNLGHWQPLTWVSYAIDYEIAGRPADANRAAAVFHFTNMVLHAANAALVYLVAVRLFLGAGLRESLPLRLAAGAGALLWGIHPLRVESVAWATERRDVLSGFFLMLTVLVYLRAFPRGSTRPVSLGAYAGSMALLALSLLSKPWAMSFFVVAIILDWYPLRRLPDHPFRWLQREHRVVLLQKVPYAVLGIASAGMTNFAMRESEAMRPLAEWPLSSRLAQAAYGLVWYPVRTIWPSPLAPLYELRHGLDPLEPQYLACYAIVALVAALTILFRHRIPAVTAAVAAFVVCIAPVLGLTQCGDQFVADRYSYLSTIGLFIAGAGGLLLLVGRFGRSAAAGALAVLVLVIAASAVGTWRQTQVWKDPVTLWRTAWQKNPTLLMAHISYGNNLVDKGGLDEAMAHYRIATQLKPRDGRGWMLLANGFRDKGDWAAAEDGYRKAAEYLPQAYLPLVNLGNLLWKRLGRSDEALECYRRAVYEVEHPRPGSTYAAYPYLSLGAFLKANGNADEARQLFQRVLNDPKATLAEREQARGHLAELGL